MAKIGSQRLCVYFSIEIALFSKSICLLLGLVEDNTTVTYRIPISCCTQIIDLTLAELATQPSLSRSASRIAPNETSDQ